MKRLLVDISDALSKAATAYDAGDAAAVVAARALAESLVQSAKLALEEHRKLLTSLSVIESALVDLRNEAGCTKYAAECIRDARNAVVEAQAAETIVSAGSCD